MSDIVWVALISASGAVAAALMTQLLTTRAAARQADRIERKEALQWQRSEARRTQDLRATHLREFWSAVLQSQHRIVDFLSTVAKKGPARSLVEESAVGAAARAYAVALIGLADVRPLAKDFYLAVVQVQLSLEAGRATDGEVDAWKKSFDALERALAQEHVETEQGL